MFINQKVSLEDILGKDYIGALCAANSALGMMDAEEAAKIASEKIDFYSEEVQKKNDELLSYVGKQIAPVFTSDTKGAGTNAYMKAASDRMSPVTGFANYRLGEDGKLYLIGKSEHYHTPLGHRFNGYRLIDNARRLGILNATHNNTRGYVTRLMEKRLVQSANGIEWEDEVATAKVLASTEPKVLNRVINLETGSLSCEAAFKMMLARFYKLDATFAEPKYHGKTPVFFVMGDKNGGVEGNYHGTTVLLQTFRGLWPEFRDAAEENGLYKVVPVMINDIADFEEKIKKYNSGNYKTAGFMHEIILMNYGGIRLTKEFLQAAYKLCAEYDTPTMCDEIQELKATCKEHHLKVILETGALKTAANIKKASILSMYAGADFIKTSTGKQQPAATPEAAYVMCQAIKEYHALTGNKIGFKPAGGINCVNDALIYYTIVKEVLGEEWLNNGLFRLGTSRLANLLLSEIKGEEMKFF